MLEPKNHITETHATVTPRQQNLWTKLRPGVFEFLEACRGLFEMHIYTMGDRTYAAQVREV